jgi:cyclopropane-fatty-acyl-phospholipid synthase
MGLPQMLIYKLLETNLLPNWLIRLGIRRMLQQTIKTHKKTTREEQQASLMQFVDELKTMPIAIETDAANTQHYEVPAEFFTAILGKYKKYSACLWESSTTTLTDAESNMLNLYCQRAGIANGQNILDLGCGWGSFTLYAAERFPDAKFTALSNSSSQREYIEAQAKIRNLHNVTVVTANIATFQQEWKFDRIVSVEMLEHMKNYQQLFQKISGWLHPEGLFFTHIFTHQQFAYHYQDTDGTDWLTRYFFTGGTMPSADLFHYFQADLCIEKQWVVNGTHYQKTANAWVDNMKANRDSIILILEKVYGTKNVTKWWVYWKVFFLACAELWGYQNGQQWTVNHYLFSPQHQHGNLTVKATTKEI